MAIEADLAGSSAGAVLSSIFMWPLYMSQASRSLAAGSRSERSKGQEAEDARPLTDYTWNWNSITFSESPGPRACPDLLLTGGVARLHYRRACEMEDIIAATAGEYVLPYFLSIHIEFIYFYVCFLLSPVKM